MSATREYGAAIFSPGLGEVLLIKHEDGSGWSFPFAHTNESDVHVVAAASSIRQLLGLDIGDKINKTHWIEAEFPQTGALVRLYIALGIRPDSVTPRCAPGASASWHPLRSIFPPVNAILRADHGASGGPTGNVDADEEGGLVLEAGIAPFLAKLKALLNKHPEWRISQLDPKLMSLIQEAMTPPPASSQQQPQGQQPQGQQPQGQQPQGQQPQAETACPPQEGPQQQQQQPMQQREEEGDQEGAGGESKPGAEAPAGEPGGQQPQQAEAAAAEQPAGASGEGPPPGRELEDGDRPESAGSDGGGDPGSAAQAAEAEGAAAEAAVGSGGSGAPAAGRQGRGDAAGGDGGDDDDGVDGGDGGWRGPRPQEHLLEYCRANELPEPCYSLVVKKSARRPLVTASCILSHLGVQITPDMHVPGGIHAACQAAALAALLWLEGALPPDGGEAVRVVPVGWPPLLSEARGESWEAAQLARRAGGARRELDTAQREALLREMDKKRQRLVAEAAELERLMAALRGGEAVPEPDLSRLTASLGLGGNGGGGTDEGGTPVEGTLLEAATPGHGNRGAKRGAGGADVAGDGGGGLTGLAGSVTVGLRALQFRSSSDNTPGPGSEAAAASGGGGGGGHTRRAGGERAPGTKRPREDGQAGSGQPGDGGAVAGGRGYGATQSKNVVMALKEFCDRKRWPQPQYSFMPGAGAGAAAVVTLPPAAGVREVSSGPQSNRKRAKEAAAAAALAQLSALGLK